MLGVKGVLRIWSGCPAGEFLKEMEKKSIMGKYVYKYWGLIRHHIWSWWGVLTSPWQLIAINKSAGDKHSSFSSKMSKRV